MAGHGSQDRDPQRRGSSPADAGEPVRRDRPGLHGLRARLSALIRRFERGFSRTFTAMAMAEDGTRDMALEQLGDEEENEVTASGAVADRRGDEPQQD